MRAVRRALPIPFLYSEIKYDIHMVGPKQPSFPTVLLNHTPTQKTQNMESDTFTHLGYLSILFGDLYSV